MTKPFSKKPAEDKKTKLAKERKSKPAKNTGNVAPVRLELLFTIVNRSKAEYYIDLLESFDANVQLVTLGHGTANADMLAFFGLSDSDKAVIISIVNSERVSAALEALDRKFKTIRNGKGIAYTVPMTGIIGSAIFAFLSNNRKAAVKDGAK